MRIALLYTCSMLLICAFAINSFDTAKKKKPKDKKGKTVLAIVKDDMGYQDTLTFAGELDGEVITVDMTQWSGE